MSKRRGRESFQKYKPIITVLSVCLKVFPRFIRSKLFEKFRKTKGKKGIVIRYIILKTIAKECGDNVCVHPNVYLFSVSNLSLGNNISIHPMCYIDATGGFEIGSDVSIAHAVTILSTTHTFEDKEIPIKDQPVDYKKTVIESNVWIGAKAVIVCGRKVSGGAVIAAGAVVTHDIPANVVVAGVPARIMKEC